MFSLDMLKDSMVIIYGAGGVATQFIKLMQGRLAECKIAVSERQFGARELLGIRIYGIEELRDDRETAVVIVATTPSNQDEICSSLKEMSFKNIYTVDDVMDCVYADLYAHPVVNNKILLSNFQGKGYGCNPKYITEALLSHDDLDIVWATDSACESFPAGVRTVKYDSFDHYKELATARIWVDNRHKSYLSRKREGQYYIQTWHGCGPTKIIDYDADNLPVSYLETVDHDASMIDLCLSGNEFTARQFQRAFGYSGEVAEYGFPRNDIFFKGADRAAIMRKLGITGEKKVLLYAPTFRDDLKVIKDGLNLDRMIKVLQERDGKEYVALERQHPDICYAGGDKAASETIIDVSEYDDVQELMYVADILITDYSSVMWDFSLQRKPVFLYHTDADAYEKERGYYLSFSEYPYIEVTSNDELAEAFIKYDEKCYLDHLDNFFKEYVPYDRGIAAEKTVEKIMEIIADGK